MYRFSMRGAAHPMTPSGTLHRLTALLLVIALAVGTMGLAATSARANPNKINVDTVTIVDSNGNTITEAQDGQEVWLQVELSILNSAVPPVNGTLSLPPSLRGKSDKFPMYAPDGTRNGECTVYATYVYCAVDDSYVVAHPENMSGAIRFRVELDVGNTDEEDKDFVVGGEETQVITVRPKPGPSICTENCSYNGSSGFKGGGYNTVEEKLEYWVYLPSPGNEGMPVGAPITVTEHFDLASFTVEEGYPKMASVGYTFINDEGREVTGYYGDFNDFTVSDDKRIISFTSAPGRFGDPTLKENERGLKGRLYIAYWNLYPKDGGAAGTYRNDVSIDVGGDTPSHNDYDTTVKRESGSAEAVGENSGKLALTKKLESDDYNLNELPAKYQMNWKSCDTTVSGYNQATHSGPSCEEGGVLLSPDQTFFFKQMPIGTRLVVSEATLVEPEGATWDTQFKLVDSNGNQIGSGNGTEILDITFDRNNGNLGQITYYQAVNKASMSDGSFTAKKRLDNPDKVNMSGVGDYRVEYTWQVPGGASGNGHLMLKPGADGSYGASQESGPIPFGADVTVTEVLPSGPAHTSWKTPVISPSTFTISQNNPTVEVLVLNEIDQDPGTFSVKKTVVNDDDVDLSGLTYKLNYTVSNAGSQNGIFQMDFKEGVWTDSGAFPSGATIKVSEGALPPIPGTEWENSSSYPQIKVNGVVTDEFTIDTSANTEIEIEVINKIEQLPGTFSARKVVSNPDGLSVDPNWGYTLNYSWTAAGSHPAGSGTMVLHADDEQDFSEEIGAGATVTISEIQPSAPPGSQWSAPSFTLTGATLLNGNSFVMPTVDQPQVEIRVTNTLNVQSGEFTARKSIVNLDDVGLVYPNGYPNPGAQLAYSLYYSWTYGSGGSARSGNGFLTLNANGSPATATGIPYGSEVTVNEVAPPDLAGATWVKPVLSINGQERPGENITFTLAPGDQVEIGAKNEIIRQKANFHAYKQVTNNDGLDLSGVPTFELKYTYTKVGRQEAGRESLILPMPRGNTLSPQDIRDSIMLFHGTQVTVTEVAPTTVTGGQWSAPVIVNSSFTIDADSYDAVEVIAQNTITSKKGSFSAQKFVANDDGIDLSRITSFQLEYTYTAVNAFPAGSGTLTVLADGTIAHSAEIPHGARVTVREVDPTPVPGGTWWEPVLSQTEFVIDTEDPTPILITVRNGIDLKFIPFKARKSVTNTDGINLSGVPSYRLDYTYTAVNKVPGGSGFLTLLANGDPAESVSLPHGSTVTVTEVTPSRVAGATWDPPVYSNDSFVVDTETDVFEITVSNTIKSKLATFGAFKSIDNPDGVDVTAVDEFELEYTYSAVNNFPAGGGSFKIKSDGTVAHSELIPHGALVTVTEVTPTYVPGTTWQEPQYSVKSFVMDTDVSEVIIEVGNPVVSKLAPFTAVKDIDNPDGIDLSDVETFELAYEYTAVNKFPAGEGVLRVPADGTTATSPAIPHGAKVTVWEVDPDAVPGATWGDPTLSIESFVIDTEVEPIKVEIENPIESKWGSFDAYKSIENFDGVDVSSIEEYVLEYEYSAVNNLQAGSGSIVLNADGTVATSGLIPHGAEVTVTEVTPAAIDGATWNAPEYSVEKFVMDTEVDSVVIEVENPIESKLVPFSAFKTIDNPDGVDLSSIESFELEYEYTAVNALPAGSGVLVVPADGSAAESQEIPHGAEVTVREVTPKGVPGATWKEPVLSIENFVIDTESEVIVIEVENSISSKWASFSAHKKVENPDGVDLGSIRQFELEYEYPPVNDLPGGSGSLVLSADGTLVESELIPHGAVVTVTEVAPKEIQDAAWDAPEYSAETFVVDTEIDPLVVEVVNRISNVPFDGNADDGLSQGPGSKPGNDSGGELSDTGAGAMSIMVALTVVFLSVGVLLVVMRRPGKRIRQ